MPDIRHLGCWNTPLPGKHISVRVGAGSPPLVCLCGFMGSGKTTVGMALAAKLQLPFMDLDDLIVAAEGRSIQAIFAEEGETYFRRIESATLQDLLNWSMPQAVIALGGGAFIQEINRERLRKARSLTVFLNADHDVLYERCRVQGDVRPLLQDRERFRELYEQRRPIYLAEADLVVEVGGRSPQEIVAEIAQRIATRVAVPD